MRIRGNVSLFLFVAFLCVGDVLAFADTNEFVSRVSRCLPKTTAIFSVDDATRYHWNTTGEFFRVWVYTAEARKPKPPRRVIMWSGPPIGVWVCFLSERYRPDIFSGPKYMTRIPVASCPEYDVVLMTSEVEYSWFLDPVWQEFYERLKKEFAVVPIGTKEGP